MPCSRCIASIDQAVDTIRELAELTPWELPEPDYGHPLADRLVALAGHLRRLQAADRQESQRLLLSRKGTQTTKGGNNGEDRSP